MIKIMKNGWVYFCIPGHNGDVSASFFLLQNFKVCKRKNKCYENDNVDKLSYLIISLDSIVTRMMIKTHISVPKS